MYILSSQNGRDSYGIKEFVLDSKEDLEKLPQCSMGSTAFVISSSEVYMKNSLGEWSLI